MSQSKKTYIPYHNLWIFVGFFLKTYYTRHMNNLYDTINIINYINKSTLPLIHNILWSLSIHVGEYKWSAKNEDFSGWMKCDGRSLSRSVYKDLYEVIGTSFGANDQDTFKLPDYRGRVMGCIGDGIALSSRNIGNYIGNETHTLDSTQIPSHTHIGSANTTGSHNHSGVTSSGGIHDHTINDPGHTHTQTTINDDYNNSGTNPPGFASDSAGTKTWNNINTSTTGISINTSGNHNHIISTDGSHTHTITVSNTGGGLAHNNMQPTLFGGNVFIFIGVVFIVD